jgi:gamma-carbonic anhydrase
MFIYPFNGKMPKIAASALIAPNVTIIGDVEIGENCSIWPGVTIRSDTTPIRIGNNVHIEENSILHTATHIEDDVMIGHGCCIEGFIGTGCMLGNTASMMPMSKLGPHSTLAAGSIIMDMKEFPEWSFITGIPAKVHSAIDPEDPKHAMRRSETYLYGPRGIKTLAEQYRAQGIWARD